MKVFLALVTLFLSGCADLQTAVESTPQNQSADFRYDLYGTVNGAAFNGVGVVPFSKTYSMNIISKVDVDLLRITSCHRDFSAESAIKLGWFDSKRGYNYVFNPSAGIEDVGSCLVRIGAYNKDKGQNAWGILDFESPDRTFPAQNLCDGKAAGSNGVSICQSKAGLIEKIVFPLPAIQSAKVDPKCVMKKPADGMTWEYVLQPGECVMEFMELAAPNRLHRHTTIGYSDIEIRGN